MKNKTLGLLSLLISFFLIFSILSPISVFAEEDIDSSTPGVKTVQFSGTDITIDGITVGMGGSSGDAVKSGNITWPGGKLQINNKGEIETLLNHGKKPSTTHKDAGGTGMGFMNTFDTLKGCKASFIIEEYGKPATDNFTKVLKFKFDNKNEFKICTYRKEEIEKQDKEKILKVENLMF